MDILQEYFLSAIHLYNSADPYLQPVRNTFYTVQSRSLPIITPYLDTLADYAANSSGLLIVAFAVILLLLAKAVLSWIWRTILFWLRISFYAAVILALAIAWKRGFEETGRDLGRWAGELGQFWLKEYERFEGYQKLHHERQGMGGGHAATSSWR